MEIPTPEEIASSKALWEKWVDFYGGDTFDRVPLEIRILWATHLRNKQLALDAEWAAYTGGRTC